MAEYLSEKVIKVVCPRFGALQGQSCVSNKGNISQSPHSDRVRKYIGQYGIEDALGIEKGALNHADVDG